MPIKRRKYRSKFARWITLYNIIIIVESIVPINMFLYINLFVYYNMVLIVYVVLIIYYRYRLLIIIYTNFFHSSPSPGGRIYTFSVLEQLGDCRDERPVDHHRRRPARYGKIIAAEIWKKFIINRLFQGYNIIILIRFWDTRSDFANICTTAVLLIAICIYLHIKQYRYKDGPINAHN